MYAACPKYGDTYRHKWTGEDLADFISLSIYTGLRISDVALFTSTACSETGEILLRTTKAGTHVYTWVPNGFRTASAPGQEHGHYIFGAHTRRPRRNHRGLAKEAE